MPLKLPSALVVAAATLALPVAAADADDHGMVVTCDDVRVWDVRNLGDVAVHRTGGTDRYRPGNALTVPAVTSEGAVTFIDTDHHDYTVTVPAACLPATTTTSTTTTSTTTTTVPPSSTTTTTTTVPPSSTTTTTEAPTASPPVSSTTTVPAPPVTPSTPGPDTPPLPGPGPSLPTAPPATPVAETPRFTG